MQSANNCRKIWNICGIPIIPCDPRISNFKLGNLFFTIINTRNLSTWSWNLKKLSHGTAWNIDSDFPLPLPDPPVSWIMMMMKERIQQEYIISSKCKWLNSIKTSFHQFSCRLYFFINYESLILYAMYHLKFALN